MTSLIIVSKMIDSNMINSEIMDSEIIDHLQHFIPFLDALVPDHIRSVVCVYHSQTVICNALRNMTNI